MLIFISGLAMLDIIWYRTELLELLTISFLMTIVYSSPLLKFRGDSTPKKKISILKKIILLSLTWTFTTVAFPASLLSDPFEWPLVWIALERFVFMMMLSAIFEMKDHPELSGGLKRTAVFFMLFQLIIHSILASQMGVISFFYMSVIGGLAFLLFILSLLKRRGYLFYYFFVDGLMLLMSVAGYLASI